MKKPFTPSKIKDFSGVMARQFRNHLAAASERPADTIRSLKFPLEVQNPPSWEDVNILNKTINSSEQGSLIRLLYTLHLNGFRVFSKQSETEAFRNGQHLDDDEWVNAVISSSPLTLAAGDFVPSKIYQRILFAPRSTGGKDSGFTPETIALEYAKYFCNGKSKDKIPQAETDLFLAIGQAFVGTFANWKELTSSPVKAGQAIDGALKSLGYLQSPTSLQARFAKIKPVEPSGTLAYDPSSPKIVDCDELEPHMIVALGLGLANKSGITDKGPATKFVQEYITGDANHGGLAWIYGKGLVEYLQVTSLDQAAADFVIPKEEAHYLNNVLTAAKQIISAEETILGGKNYASYRSSIGGVVGSWVANYISRLFELRDILAVPVEPLALPKSLLDDALLLSELGTSIEQLNYLVDHSLSVRELAKDSLGRLMGHWVDGVIVSAKDVFVIENYSEGLESLAGSLASIQTRIAKLVEYAERDRDEAAIAHLKQYQFETPKWIARLNKINRLNLKSVQIEDELNVALAQFTELREAMFSHFGSISSWAASQGIDLDPFLKEQTRETNYKNSHNSKVNPQEQSYRRLIDRLGRSARKCSDATLQKVVLFFKAQNIFATDANLNQYFFNRKGSLFRSAFDKSPHKAFAIQKDCIENRAQFLIEYGDFLKALRKEVFTSAHLELSQFSDLFLLEQAFFGVLLNGLPEAIPSRLAYFKPVIEAKNLPIDLILALQAPTVGSAIVRKVFNYYYGQLNSLAAVLLRKRFFLRAKFQRAGDNSLLYCPSSSPWKAPSQLFDSAAPIGDVMRRLEAIGDGSRVIDPLLASYALADISEDLSRAGYGNYLRQAPHDWSFEWKLGNPVEGQYAGKDGLGKKVKKSLGSRLIGTSAYKGVLDAMVANPDKVSIGDFAIIIDQPFFQELVFSADGKFHIKVAQSDQQTMSLSLPVKEALPEKTELAFENYVAIDIGERGLSFAVFNAKSHTLVEKGRVLVKSMTRVVKDVAQGKRKKSATVKFKAKFDPAELNRRENVVGDFCTAINRLMWYFKAFPVLEYSAGGAGKGVDPIYNEVLSRYLYNTTATVDSARKSYWSGASYWVHPEYKNLKFDKAVGKRGNAVVPLNLFPGAGVSSYGTSQTCSCCKRNPIEMVRQMQLDAGKTKLNFPIHSDGAIHLGNDKIHIYFSNTEEAKASAKSNKRTPLNKLPEQSGIASDDLLRAIKRNLRQAPSSKATKDTAVSQYHCVFEDCSQSLHADVNAAINIGEKFANNQKELLAS